MNKTILAVGAHPDDMDFTSSGTIAKYIAEGATAYYLICTDGSRGSADPEMTHEQLTQVRKVEQIKAAEVLGVKEVFFLDHSDTQLDASIRLKEQIVRFIRKLKPQIVFTMNPTFYFAVDPFGTGISAVNHTDHRAVGLATMDAVFPLARDRLTFPEHEIEGLSPHKVDELYFPTHEKGLVIDITEYFEKKLEAIASHESQYESFDEIKERMTKRAEYFAKNEKFRLAENFVRLVLPD